MKILFITIIIWTITACNVSERKEYIAVPEIQDISTEKWKTVKDYDFLTFSIPDNLLKQDIHGRDNLFVEYSNDEMSVSFESGVGSDTLRNIVESGSVEKYEKKEVINQGIKGVQIDYQYLEGKAQFRHPNKRFAKTVGFDCEREGNSVTFLILFANPESSKIAEKIIQSISPRCF